MSNDSETLNDVHSQLNRSRPLLRRAVASLADVQRALTEARRRDLPVAICAGRHAMGGQQFVHGGLQIDMAGFDRVLAFDAERGLLRVEAGLQWPALMTALEADPRNRQTRWGIRQKQTGADRFSIGGSHAANIHGRGLCMRPFVDDVEAFVLMDADGRLHHCARDTDAERFALASGGYGLFGVVVELTLRLSRWCHVAREVELIDVDALLPRLTERISEGCLYGDFQFAIDPNDAGFLRRGVLSCYRRVDDAVPLTAAPIHLGAADWDHLLHLAHVDKRRAFAEFSAFYRRSDGQIYRSDQHQAGYYLDGYHGRLDARLDHHGSEVISELYVPRERLIDFMSAAAERLRLLHADVIYGTVRLVERDEDSVLRWAREPWACVIFNLHSAHDAAALAHLGVCKRALIDLAITLGGSYYLTYHRYASLEQLRACHPSFDAFVEAKRRFDPEQRFRSDWYRHYAGASD